MNILPPSDLPADLTHDVAAYRKQNANLIDLTAVLEAIAVSHGLRRGPPKEQYAKDRWGK